MAKQKERKTSTNGYEGYKLSPEERSLFTQAEDHFSKGDYEKARDKYLQLTKLRPDFAPALTYLGQTYEKTQQVSEAIKYEELAIKANYYDYLAHYFVADNYAVLGNYQRAADEIVIASILNRNNDNVKKAMARILPAAGYTWSSWCFEPQVLIHRTDDKSVSVKWGPNWIGWAIAKAAWRFEPDFRKKARGTEPGRYNSLEDRDWLVSLLVGLDADSAQSWKSQPELATLHKAYKDDMFQEYLMYEVVLPKFPKAVYQVSRDGLDEIRKYVLKTRL